VQKLNNSKSSNFVNYVLETINTTKAKGFSAKLKRADNEATEYQSWEILSRWVSLEDTLQRKSYCLIAASLARSEYPQDGSLSLGMSLRQVFIQDGGEGEIEKSSSSVRMRRILACRDANELLEIIRPVLRLLESKGINYSRRSLLDEILWFNSDLSRERTRAHWAQDFYGSREEKA
jgi:CRISPR system Cascade subunit CasB